MLSLVKEDGEDGQISLVLASALANNPDAVFSHRLGLTGVLSDMGMREVETLNAVSLSGDCQFSSLSETLYGRLCSQTFRPDLRLRKQACDTIAGNLDMYQDFLVQPNARTRGESGRGGAGVCMSEYLAKMKRAGFDGDHVTLQAMAGKRWRWRWR